MQLEDYKRDTKVLEWYFSKIANKRHCLQCTLHFVTPLITLSRQMEKFTGEMKLLCASLYA